jgi:hypothetical protein
MGLDEGMQSLKREITLHRAVLDKALVDMYNPSPKIRNDAKNWLRLNSKDFITACERAWLEPELVYKTFHIILSMLQGDKAAFKKLGPRKSKG